MQKQRRRLGRTRIGISLVMFSGALAAWAAACSGSDSSDVVQAQDAAPEAAPDTSLPDVVVADVILDVVKDTGPMYDAGQPNVLDGGDLYEGGIPCVVGGQLEEEPNDDRDAANPVMPTRCGVVLVDADGGTSGNPLVAESDFLTFTLPSTTKSFYIQFAGDVSLKIDVEGNPSVTITPTMSGNVPLVKDKPYFIEVRSLNGKVATWRVTIFAS